MKCEKCGNKKIVSEQCVFGFPGYVEGTRQEYCGLCGPFPVQVLVQDAS